MSAGVSASLPPVAGVLLYAVSRRASVTLRSVELSFVSRLVAIAAKLSFALSNAAQAVSPVPSLAAVPVLIV